ncbi:YqaJ viral recombinase family protein [Sphingopyxis sp. BSN-002]|uniref:lambda exonuclease family protein n=1 Tax=Sphingopyxis sp. BSN-002 TaxID=2911495 RepID=UPI001EDB814E|nr:lambda exonuclease family protein [Sphingopyxis sp. BSN-002]QVJ07671.1 YqaJ-like viral recombinase domain protein [Sphingopyxis phage VSN-002]UKK84720.1 YqaJ viral recombinase family protein [Sphingopyxis sp. BSN-002]
MDEIEQRSPEWFAERCGKVTASKIADLMARTQKGWGASRANYAAQLVCERLTGTAEQGYSNAAMQWGTDWEPEAREAYGLHVGEFVDEIGFARHPVIADSGASPDGLVGDDGLVEIKCPNSATHIATLRGEPIADKYIKQMQWQMACTGRQWCDFASYDPRLPERMRLHVARVSRDQAMIDDIEAHVQDFLAEVAATVADLEARYLKEAA